MPTKKAQSEFNFDQRQDIDYNDQVDLNAYARRWTPYHSEHHTRWIEEVIDAMPDAYRP